MNETFRKYVESLEPSLEALRECTPFRAADIPKGIPQAGVYLFSEFGRPLYVGRTNTMRRRLQQHCRPGSGHNTAPFAFLLARLECGTTKASYRPEGSRKALLEDPEFARAFKDQKERIRSMDIQVVEEAHSLKQALLEMYIAVALGTPHNDFDNH